MIIDLSGDINSDPDIKGYFGALFAICPPSGAPTDLLLCPCQRVFYSYYGNGMLGPFKGVNDFS